MLVHINFSNLLTALILLVLGVSVFTRHRIASYIVGGFLTALALLSILSFAGILSVQGVPREIHFG
jgi:hypothetical protein